MVAGLVVLVRKYAGSFTECLGNSADYFRLKISMHRGEIPRPSTPLSVQNLWYIVKGPELSIYACLYIFISHTTVDV